MRLNERQTERVLKKLDTYSSMVDRLTGMFKLSQEGARADLTMTLSLLERGYTTYAREYLLLSLLAHGALEGQQLLDALDLKMKADAERAERGET